MKRILAWLFVLFLTGNSFAVLTFGAQANNLSFTDGRYVNLTGDTMTGSLGLGANNLNLTGSIATTGSRALKGWFTDLELTNMPSVGATSIQTTFVDVAGDTMTGKLNITIPNAGNVRALDVYQNDVTNNPIALSVTNAGTNAAISLSSSGGGLDILGTNASWEITSNGKLGLGTSVVDEDEQLRVVASVNSGNVTAHFIQNDTVLNGSNVQITNAAGVNSFALDVSSNNSVGLTPTARIMQNGSSAEVISLEITEALNTRSALVFSNAGLGADITGTNSSWEVTNQGTLTANSIISRNSVQVDGRILGKQGADVSSTATMEVGYDGNTFEITGSETIESIVITGWQNGSEINLLFKGSLTITHNATAGAGSVPILLSGSADFSATAGDVLTLLLCELNGVQAWRQQSRTAI